MKGNLKKDEYNNLRNAIMKAMNSLFLKKERKILINRNSLIFVAQVNISK